MQEVRLRKTMLLQMIYRPDLWYIALRVNLLAQLPQSPPFACYIYSAAVRHCKATTVLLVKHSSTKVLAVVKKTGI